MIIRAVTDSDSDDDWLPAARATSSLQRSVFDPPEPPAYFAGANNARSSWFAACGALVLLLLVDLAAVSDPFDVFALLPLFMSTVYYKETVPLPPVASILNQCVGFALVSVWIYTREKSLGAGTQWLRRTRYGLWTVGALMCLGHVVSCLYVLFALFESNGDRTKFWLGRKRARATINPYGRA